MRIQNFDLCTHILKFVEIGQSSLKEDLENTTHALSLCHKDAKWCLKIGRESWENIRLDFGCLQGRLVSMNCHIFSANREDNSHALHRSKEGDEIIVLHASNRHLPLRERASDQEATCFEVISTNSELSRGEEGARSMNR